MKSRLQIIYGAPLPAPPLVTVIGKGVLLNQIKHIKFKFNFYLIVFTTEIPPLKINTVNQNHCGPASGTTDFFRRRKIGFIAFLTLKALSSHRIY